MAEFYLDHNVPRRVALLLRDAGHGATTARELRYEYASDTRHLLVASRRGAILVTHDDDYLRIHHDWHSRPAILQAVTMHAGILLIPAFPIWDATRTAREIGEFLRDELPLIGELYQWTNSGWLQR